MSQVAEAFIEDAEAAGEDSEPELLRPSISKHIQAPLFAQSNPELVFQQILSEVESGNYPATKAFLSVFRQAALVNLWFFLRCVLAYNGPYSEIDSGIHLEMCNFRQDALRIGARYACAMPRSGLKSTIWTHGAMTWELTRNPNLCAGIISFPQARAIEFFKLVKTNFESNALLHELFPETIPSQENGSRWTEAEIVMPGRTELRQDPSLKPITAGGATQGIHLDLANFDDLVGDSMLDSDRHATADMVSMSNWFSDNQATMLRHPEKSRVVFPFTRYGLVDPGEEIMLNAQEHAGNWFNVEEWYPEEPHGEWHVYYRSARNEEGESILPDRFSTDFLNKFQKKNPIGYMLNYANDPHVPEAADLSMYTLKHCDLDYDENLGHTIRFASEGTATLLMSTNVVQVIDPAGGTATKGKRSQASQTAHLVLATLADGRQCILEAKADFVRTSKWWDWLFETAKKPYPLVRTAAELQAGFKSLESLIEEEQCRRSEIPLKFKSVQALGDKDTTIRAYVQPVLEKGLLYATPAAYKLVSSAIKTFPGGRKDILDALKIAIYISRKPLTSEESEAYDNEVLQAEAALGRNPVTGY